MNNLVLTGIQSTLEDRLLLFAQATIPVSTTDDNHSLTPMDLIEMINLARDETVEQLTTEEVFFITGKTAIAGGYDKYSNDCGYKQFWTDVEANIIEIINETFSHDITLITGVKRSVPSSAKRFCSLIVAPIIAHFRQFHPTNVLVSSNGFFDWMVEFANNTEVSSSSDDVLAARKTLSSLSRGEEASYPTGGWINTPTEILEEFTDEDFGFDGEELGS